MASSSEDEECPFFDASEDIASFYGATSDSIEIFDSYYGFNSDVWVRTPRSVKERRSNFLDQMEVGLDGLSGDKSMEMGSLGGEVDRLCKKSGAVMRRAGAEEEFVSIRSARSSWSNDNLGLLEEKILRRDGNYDREMVCDVDDIGKDGKMIDGREMGLENISGLLPHLDEIVEKENSAVGKTERVKKGWFSRLLSFACVVDKQGEFERTRPNQDDAMFCTKVQRVKVHQCKKRSKEFSALFKGQEIQAHEGSILTMKFSHDGQYLASAGEDGVVRLWQVVEDERSTEVDIPEICPSCIYFTVNHLSELKPLYMDKEKLSIFKSLRRTSESACVIFPPKVFRILEKPLHEFHGHSDEILDLSWSKNNYLLSASIDKTVCLWRVGSDHCLRVFPHSNYVTCVHFNPVDDNYFISGSIDGKVRIWAVPGCQVVDWVDVREIVTAVCYCPDGQGGIIGSMMGDCRFYNMSDNHLQLDAEICVHSKKKGHWKRITGFQFLPQDSSKVMVTSADSQVRILQGPNVIGKYKGLRRTGNQLSASFTSDGKHIVSACEDSNVYIWNCSGQEEPVHDQAKNIRSFEHFTTNASIAIPWCGLKYGNSVKERRFHVSDGDSLENLAFAPACFSLGQEYILDSFPKGSATWPEEKLPALIQLLSTSTMRKSQYKFLKSSCHCTTSSHAWGLVIVTAGWDGRIRSFLNYGLPIPV